MTSQDSTPTTQSKPTYVKRLEIDDLFGYLSYSISGDVDYRRLMMLYGDNGSGKTTILKLLFSLLSSKEGRGDKTFVSTTPFRRFAVYFDDNTCVVAEKQEELIGAYSVVIQRPSQDEHRYVLKPNAKNNITGDEPFPQLLQGLRDLTIALYFLPDDRRARSTYSVEAVESEEDADKFTIFTSAAYKALSGRTDTIEVSESHHLNIIPVLTNVSSWFRRHAFQGSNTGEENATSIYLQVIQQIAALAGSAPAAESSFEKTLVDRLARLAARMESFSRFALIPPFPAERFLSVFVNAPALSRPTIATVLEPYIDGIEARLTALEGVRQLLTTYVETTNSFLTGKSIEFTLQRGAVVRGYSGHVIDPNLLSSGEKQLILLLSNAILARDGAGIFLIDEPELSLNIKWQRRLVQALLDCAKGANIQYILASHSLELITLHKRNAIRLVSRLDHG